MAELTIINAEGLKNNRCMRKTFVAAFVEDHLKSYTRVLANGGRNPIWNETIQIYIRSGLASDPSATLTIQVFNQGAFTSTLAGATQLRLQDLLQLKGNGEGDILTRKLFRPSGQAHGIIRISFKLSGDGLPGLPRLLDDDLDVACYESALATGILVMPAVGIHSAATPLPAEHSTEQDSYPYPAPSYVCSAYLPSPVHPSPYPYPAPSYVCSAYLPSPVPPSPYPYPAPSYVRSAYLPDPVPYPRRNNNFFFGLVIGVVATLFAWIYVSGRK